MSVFGPKLTRRNFARGVVGLGGIAMIGPGCASTAAGKFFARNRLPVGLQLYTLGDAVKTDLEGTLKAVSAIGYRTVEMNAYPGRKPLEVRAALDASGLSCNSVHASLSVGTREEPGLHGDLGRLAQDVRSIGADFIIASIYADIDPIRKRVAAGEGDVRSGLLQAAAMMKPDDWRRLAGDLNDIGRRLAGYGMMFGYHNHNVELQPLGGGTILDLLAAETQPGLVAFELDVGWVAAAGADPFAVLDRLPGRVRLMHIKDLKTTTAANFELRMDPAEVGAGRLDWARLLPGALSAGVRRFYVEQEPPFAQPRIEAAAQSYRFLANL